MVRVPSNKNAYRNLRKRLGTYQARVEDILSDLSTRASRAAVSVGYEGSSAFLFSEYPELKATIEDMMQSYASRMESLVYSGISTEWEQSNTFQDALADKVLKAYHFTEKGERRTRYYQTNNDALRAFRERTVRGMNLSRRIWSQAEGVQAELEAALSAGVEKGMSAVALSKRVSQYLKDFPSLQRDYGERYGKAADIHDCEYRSARLARSEINMAYRNAEQERWKQMDFIVGYEVKTSGSHPDDDVCDRLAGRYPKDFVFEGWHPNCLCYTVPLIKTEEEFWSGAEGSQAVTAVPDGFTDYVAENADRIMGQQARGTEPYFIRDNPVEVSAILGR